MTVRIPLFPLGTVLFPGLVLPLHIFEDRYRLLMREVLDGPKPHRFGVVGLQLGHALGHEVGAGAARSLAPVGCVAEVHTVSEHDDGRFDVVTMGAERFRLKGVDDARPYLCGEVEPLPDEAGEDPAPAARRVAGLFHRYRRRLAEAGAETTGPIELPEDPVRLSYLVAAAVVLEFDERQRLLEAEDATLRLHVEQALLIRENRLLNVLPAVPASQFVEGAVHLN